MYVVERVAAFHAPVVVRTAIVVAISVNLYKKRTIDSSSLTFGVTSDEVSSAVSYSANFPLDKGRVTSLHTS